ncbi:MAG: TIM-barrel domain-containing protein [Lachnospiraceae bacterium]|jgi:alpha-D-xyloside xylohydrolase
MSLNFFSQEDGALLFNRRGEMIEIRPWGHGIRVRATQNHTFSRHDWALSEKPADADSEISVRADSSAASVTCGPIRAEITSYGRICWYRVSDGKLLLKEYYRSWDYGTEGWQNLDTIIQQKVPARSYRNVGGDHWRICLKFEADENERIYGMGQYQQKSLNLKGSHLELAQKNTQASVPFMVSSLGYGLLWNNPAVGTASFASNLTEFTAEASEQIDVWVTCGDTPAQIVEQYTEVAGRVPMMPDWAMGFWQCKLRYQSQEEVLRIARKYHGMGVPLSVIVIDFFHWTQQGEWKFDPAYFPDPAAMVSELHSLGIRLMVSVWPTVDRGSENYREMSERDLLVRANRGMNVTMDCWGLESFIDTTNPEARKFLWQKVEDHYRRYGVDLFWLDEAEPEYSVPDFDLYRYYDGNAVSCANEYPVRYAQAFYEGMKKEGVENPINLIRCAWAGSQKYGALVWSGDVPSTFTYLRYQLTAGLNMGLAGIAWWTADIGGFHGGNVHDPAFQELLCRWFQFGAFCPVMRLHGDRDPHYKPLGTTGGGMVASGADNEIWSYTPEMQDMMEYYIRLRESMKDYIRGVMMEAHEKGTPVIKPLFYDYPDEADVRDVEDEYLFGHSLLVAPVLTAGAVSRRVALPAGRWIEYETGKEYDGGQTVTVDAPLYRIPLFVKKGAEVFKTES